jgi:NAD-dependent dihydropyrimidine dehydrogenase PreA subunit
MYDCVQNIYVYEFEIIHVLQKNLKHYLVYMELCDGCGNFVNNVITMDLWTQNMLPL